MNLEKFDIELILLIKFANFKEYNFDNISRRTSSWWWLVNNEISVHSVEMIYNFKNKIHLKLTNDMILL